MEKEEIEIKQRDLKFEREVLLLNSLSLLSSIKSSANHPIQWENDEDDEEKEARLRIISDLKKQLLIERFNYKIFKRWNLIEFVLSIAVIFSLAIAILVLLLESA